MLTLYYASKQIASAVLHHRPIKTTDCIRGWRFYRSFCTKGAKSIWGGVKPWYTVLYEIERAHWKWRCWDDAYFRFRMFKKDVGNNWDLIMSFVPQGYYYRYCENGGDSRYTVLIDDKILFHNLMSLYGIPVPRIYFIYSNGKFMTSRNEPLSEDEVDSIIGSVSNEKIFMKRFTGGAASGVYCFFNEGGGFRDKSGKRLTAKCIRKSYPEDYLFFEEQLVQNNELSTFNPDTVNTIRVLTYNNGNGEYGILSAAIRFGRKGSFVDNTAKGGIAVSLDVDTGKIEEYGEREYEPELFYEHPDSKVKFLGTEVKQWPEVKKLVMRTLEILPYYKSVGFDIATTPNGPVIIEINTGAGIYLSQMGKRRGIADKLKLKWKEK